MNPGLLITLILSASLTASVIAGVAAPAKRRHPGYWTIAAFLFPPSVILLLLLPVGRGVYHQNDPYIDRDDHDEL
ncbi:MULTISPECIES: hypothetical protein [Rhodomicrobium]|uniref:hypothetical protein n=1 Tax=Rhodomicrobium TaxID=1068 RepID=UPI000B4B36EE|nr:MULTISPECIES: hypothetical protein [Rhodomicrobium]